MTVPIGQLLSDLAAADPDRLAVTCGPQTVTRAELDAWANRLARAYRDLGVRQGDFVTITLPNSVEFVAATYAVWKLGAVPQPVSHQLPHRERAAIIELAGSSLVVGAQPGEYGDRRCLPAGWTADPSLPDTPIVPAPVSPSWKAPTSGGSTGRPKLIVSRLSGDVDPLADPYRLGTGGVGLVPGPLYHNAPFVAAMQGAFLGNHVVILPRFDATAALEAIDRLRVTWVSLVPTMMLRMWRVVEPDPSRYDLSSLRTVVHGAAPCPEWLKEAWIGLVGAEQLIEVYGGSENQAGTMIDGRDWLAHRGSVGRPFTGEIRILGADGAECPPGEVGEIFMRPDGGAEVPYYYIGAEPRIVDGWESIGDLGRLDADGYLYLSDRRTDLIVAGGANVYPAEVEAALLEHPGVATCAVLGLPDEDLGQRVHALVQATAAVTADDLRAFLGERLVRYKIPRSFRFVDAPLRDEAGKVRRTALRDHEISLNGGTA
ncbi:AMP-binding protein [Dactylosporangium sp. AC04546]|uniref:AMP-binding protein n=1 Tax=Dactylosporangium sp. AC04546 TaxID=2862460 RepID=UPI001EDEF430|nr:AMP-binding protein [Dactylosporangium sp. AC04546]WVK88780.1 AMP-binding protein [Dactylosporangium sp. AC04546]